MTRLRQLVLAVCVCSSLAAHAAEFAGELVRVMGFEGTVRTEIGDDDVTVRIEGDNLGVLAGLPDGAFDLVYMDPPFNTGRAQARRTLSVAADPRGGDRVGFGGRRYRSRLLRTLAVPR